MSGSTNIKGNRRPQIKAYHREQAGKWQQQIEWNVYAAANYRVPTTRRANACIHIVQINVNRGKNMWRGKTTICETQSFSTADFDCPVLWVDQRAAVHPTHAEELERIDVLYVAQNEARKEGHEGKEWKSKEEKGELLKEKKNTHTRKEKMAL